MTENESLPMESSKDLQKRGRKKKVDEHVETVATAPAHQWVRNGERKSCPVCGAEMCGWAVRAEFRFCPMCGEQLG